VRHNVDLTAHRSRLLTTSVVRAADLIVVVDQAQRRLLCERFGRSPGDVVVLGDFDPEPVESRTIRDPVNEGLEVFAEVYERIARCAYYFATALPAKG